MAGTRTAWGPARQSCAELDAEIAGALNDTGGLLSGQRIRAAAYETLTGLSGAAERVRLEVSALDRVLGTGGHTMINSHLNVLPPDPPHERYLIEAHYMSDQVMVTGAGKQGMTRHGLLSQPIGSLDLKGMSVVVAGPYSSLPAVLARLRSPDGQEQPRVVYTMTGGDAPPLAYSHVVTTLSQTGRLTGTITAGQAWGGDIETVSIHDALLVARHVLHADATVAIQEPGNLGTETPWGFSGMARRDTINAIAALDGYPVVRLHIPQADACARHRGVSHYSMTAHGRVALAGTNVVVPNLEESLGMQVRQEAETLYAPRPGVGQHRLVEVPADRLLELLRAAKAQIGIGLFTMRRGLDEDAAVFIAAAAAGRHARQILDEGTAHG